MPADITLEKGPPQNLEAERCVLGAILLDNQLVNQAVELLRTNDFYLCGHRLIFQHMISLLENSKAIDFVTLTDSIRSSGQLDELGGASFISSLISL